MRFPYLLLVISVAAALPAQDRDQKAFSLFSIVNFPNLECTTQMSDDMKGICLTSEECIARSGTASGNCASGFGVCCFTMVDDLTATIVNNMTYIQNPGFPSPHAANTAALNYQYSIQATESTSQIRLDFQTGVWQQPAIATGACGDDVVTTVEASRPATATYTLCGVLTGQHMYLENNNAANTANRITIALPISAVAQRTWKILVRIIERGNPSILGKPQGCLQWFTGLSNTVSSFNHAVGGAMGILNDDSYTICIRREGNNDCVTWREAGGNIDSFALDMAAAAVAAIAATAAAAAVPAAPSKFGSTNAAHNCPMTALIIPNSNMDGQLLPHYCGGYLSSFSADGAAFAPLGLSTPVLSTEHHIKIFAPAGNNRANNAAASGGAAAGSGFNLIYQQTACV